MTLESVRQLDPRCWCRREETTTVTFSAVSKDLCIYSLERWLRKPSHSHLAEKDDRGYCARDQDLAADGMVCAQLKCTCPSEVVTSPAVHLTLLSLLQILLAETLLLPMQWGSTFQILVLANHSSTKSRHGWYL